MPLSRSASPRDFVPNSKDVWLTLTDYDRLAQYVPNLTQSKVKPSDEGQIRLWQEGAQKIVGFDFRASVEMFMDEHFGEGSFRVSLSSGVRHVITVCAKRLARELARAELC